MEVNVHEAKTTLSRLLRRVAAGESVVISRRGNPTQARCSTTAFVAYPVEGQAHSTT
ncbi:MAG: type II toxin-antitoxin system prevent-host-death family antitoxin [Puniceicoccaceae bacterium]|nr:MAG: type II toxin-antitoxin system prevent-host-death family antitoxin [Puniceicoccaceae bacterium]